MLIVPFSIKDKLYALDTAQVVEIVPKINLRDHPGAPPYVPGVFNYRGTIVPVVDLRRMLYGDSCPDFLGTRIILVHYPDSRSELILGLMAEHVTTIRVVSDQDISPSGVTPQETSCLGDMLPDGADMVQMILPDKLLTEEAKKVLFTKESQAAGRDSGRQ